MSFPGIFSDIHVLAMMYSGEMCYWGLKHCTDPQSENHEVGTTDFGASCTTHKEPLDFREVGEKILKKYVSGNDWKKNHNSLNLQKIKTYKSKHINFAHIYYCLYI